MATNKQAQLAIRVVRILNRHIKDPATLDAVLQELEEVLESNAKDATAPTDQSETVTS